MREVLDTCVRSSRLSWVDASHAQLQTFGWDTTIVIAMSKLAVGQA